MQINNYIIDKKITETKGSLIFKTQDNYTIKIEKRGFNYLENEIKIRKFLENITGIPKLVDFGNTNSCHYIVYTYVSNTLYKKKLSRFDVLNLGYQIVSILEKIHNLGIVHCDISLCNILYNTSNTIFYLNDFGQAKHFCFSMNERKQRSFVGSPMFCSENIHNGYEYSPRDDLISLVYVLFYTYHGRIPWMNLKNINEIHEEKIHFREKLWKWNVPDELKILANYCFHLKINEKPKYEKLKELFKREVETKEFVIHT